MPGRFRSLIRELECRPAITALAGMLVGVLLVDSTGFALTVLGAAAVLAVIVFVKGNYLSRVFAVCLLAGALSTFINEPVRLDERRFYETRTYGGVVERVSRRGDAQRCIVAVADSACGTFFCRLTYTPCDPPLRVGDKIVFRAIPRPSEADGGLPFISMSAAADKADRISAGFMLNNSQIVVTGHSDALRYKPSALADRFRDAIDSSELLPQSSQLLAASLLGSQAGMPEGGEAFRMAGLAHLFCVSGFHVGLIALVIGLMLFPMRLWTAGARLRFLPVIPLIWLFVMATGFTSAGIRAAVMLSLVFIGKMTENDVSPFNSLAAALLIILLFDPYSLFSAGLLLSAGAVLGLLLFVPAINRVSPKRRLLHMTVNCLATPLAAMLGTLPIVLCVFNSLPMLGIPANIIVVPLFPVFIYAALAAVALNTLGLPAGALVKISDTLGNFFESVAEVASSQSYSTLSGIYPSATVTILIIALIISLAAVLRAKSTGWKLAAVSSTLTIAIILCFMPYRSPRKEMIACGEDILVNNGTNARLHPLRRSGHPSGNYSRYLAARDIHPDSFAVAVPGEAIRLQGQQVFVIGKDTELGGISANGILYLHRTHRHSAEDIARLRPTLVLLSPTMSAERRLQLITEYRRLGITTHDLALRPVLLSSP